MAWTAPRTWTDTELVTASIINTHVRDNLNLLKTSISDAGALETSLAADLDNAVTINESGADVDFRVEGDTEQHLVFADASTERVGIGASAPTERLEVSGPIGSASLRLKTEDNGQADAESAHGLILECAGGNATTAQGLGTIYWTCADSAFTTTNPKGVAYIGAVGREAYTADDDGASALVFGTAPANPGTGDNVAEERVRIDESGHVGIGETTPATNLHVSESNTDTTIGANSDDDPGVLTSPMSDRDLILSGGKFKAGARLFKIRTEDMPETPPDKTSEIIYDSNTFNIEEFHLSGDGNVYMLRCNQID